jgi:hypothetical protein
MTYYDKHHLESALLAWGMSLWLFLAAREREKLEKSDGLWGWLTGRW